MYAIVEISGKQYRVQKDMKLKVSRLDSEPGTKIGFDRVLVVEDDKGNATFGKPVVSNTQVDATVIEHGRDKKVIVFKKKRRKGYKKKNGHRQGYSLIEINSIGAAKTQKKAAAVKEQPVSEKKETKKPAGTAAKPKAAPKTVKTKPKAATAKSGTAAKKTASTRKASTATAAKKPAPKKEAKEK